MIIKVMEISTAHVTENTAKELFGKGEFKKYIDIIYESEWTSRMVVPTEDYLEGLFKDVLPEDLLRCMKFARENDCDYLWFDVEGEIVDELPEYDW